MPTKTTLRLLIIIDVLLSIGSEVADYLGKSSLPEALRSFESDYLEGTANPGLYTLLGFFVLLWLALIVAWIGLFVFWRPARLIYLVVTVVALSVTPFLGPYVNTGVSCTLADAGGIVAGIILAVIYWSPLRDLYERPKTAI